MFKDNILHIKKQVDSFTGDKQTLMFNYIKRKLDRSLVMYEKEIQAQLNYLMSRKGYYVKSKLRARERKNKL